MKANSINRFPWLSNKRYFYDPYEDEIVSGRPKIGDLLKKLEIKEFEDWTEKKKGSAPNEE